jgi:hypothetical protein
MGKGAGVQRIATYPFTSPLYDLVLEPCLLHALTETGTLPPFQLSFSHSPRVVFIVKAINKRKRKRGKM